MKKGKYLISEETKLISKLNLKEFLLMDLDRNFEHSQNMFHNLKSMGWPDPWRRTDNLKQSKKIPENMTDSVKKL